MDPKSIPIIINNRDRVTCLSQLVDWLLNTGHKNIMILDNDSTYPALLEYYAQIKEHVHVERLGKNLLSKALWCWPPACKSISAPFVYTDADVIHVDGCPDNIIEFLLKVANYLGDPYKVGLSLKIDDIPDHYSQAKRVRTWESRMWEREIGQLDGVSIYNAGVDTTFALYTEFRPFSLQGVRVGTPYTAKHVGWYVESANPSPEEIYYETHTTKGTHSWGINNCYSVAVNRYCEAQEKNNA